MLPLSKNRGAFHIRQPKGATSDLIMSIRVINNGKDHENCSNNTIFYLTSQ